MKRVLFCIFLLAVPVILSAQTQTRQQGTIVRMRMTDCMGPQHPFMSAMSGAVNVEQGLLCPEYVLVGEQVVYVLSGKTSEQLLPLAEVTSFRFQKNELLVRVDDAQKESHFHIKAMVLRAEWDRHQMLEEEETSAAMSHPVDPAVMRNQ